MSNIPTGAEYRYNAPFNQKTETITVITEEVIRREHQIEANVRTIKEMSFDDALRYLNVEAQEQLNLKENETVVDYML